MVKNLPAVQEIQVQSWAGKMPWGRKWQPLQYSCLENPMDRGAWWATVHRVAKNQTLLSEKQLNWASQVMLVLNNLPANAGDLKRLGLDPWVRKILWRRKWQPTPVFLPGESYGQRSLAGYSPQGHRVGHDGSDLAHTLTSKYFLHFCYNIGPERLT